VRDVDYDVVHRTVQHVDFMQIVAGSKISTEVSIVLVGETALIGTVLQDLNSLQIECLPSELISLIEVDISALALPGDIITVKDLQVPDSVTILADDDQLVVHSEAFREEEEEVVEPTFEIGEVGLVSDEDDEAVEG
jgi:large subunit ribosomal protein L25